MGPSGQVPHPLFCKDKDAEPRETERLAKATQLVKAEPALQPTSLGSQLRLWLLYFRETIFRID